MRSYNDFRGIVEVSDPIDPQAILKVLEDEITQIFAKLQQKLDADMRGQMQKNQGLIKKAKNWWDRTWHGPNSPQGKNESAIGLESPYFLSFREDQAMKELVGILQEGWINDALSAMTVDLTKTRDALIASIRDTFTKLGHSATPPVTTTPTSPVDSPDPSNLNPADPTVNPAAGTDQTRKTRKSRAGQSAARRANAQTGAAAAAAAAASTTTSPTPTTTAPTPTTTSPVPTTTKAPSPTTTSTTTPDPNVQLGQSATGRRRGGSYTPPDDVPNKVMKFTKAMEDAKQADPLITDDVLQKAQSIIDSEPDDQKKIRMAEFMIKCQPIGVRPAIIKNPECLKFASLYNPMALNVLAPKLHKMIIADSTALDNIGTQDGFDALVKAAGMTVVTPATTPVSDSVIGMVAKMLEMFRNGEKIVVKPPLGSSPSQQIEHYRKMYSQ